MRQLAGWDGLRVATNYTEQRDRIRRAEWKRRRDKKRGPSFIGTLARLEHAWRASFRLRVRSEVFAQSGQTEVFATELQATKWLHMQATLRGFSSIENSGRASRPPCPERLSTFGRHALLPILAELLRATDVTFE